MTNRQMKRCLYEFPWLWALSRNWNSECDSITIGHATNKVFDANWRYDGAMVWCYRTANKQGSPTAFRLDLVGPGWDERIGSHVLASTAPGAEYVAFHYNEDGKNVVEIYRAPRNSTMWDFLQKRYDPK